MLMGFTAGAAVVQLTSAYRSKTGAEATAKCMPVVDIRTEHQHQHLFTKTTVQKYQEDRWLHHTHIQLAEE